MLINRPDFCHNQDLQRIARNPGRNGMKFIVFVSLVIAAGTAQADPLDMNAAIAMCRERISDSIPDPIQWGMQRAVPITDQDGCAARGDCQDPQVHTPVVSGWNVMISAQTGPKTRPKSQNFRCTIEGGKIVNAEYATQP